MKTITSLSNLLLFLMLCVYHNNSLKGQVCNPDIEPPTFTNCQNDIVIDLIDPSICSWMVSWPPPAATDLCVRTNMLNTPGANFFTYYDELVLGSNGQFLRHGSDSMTIVGTTNGIGPRVFQACFFATCTGTLNFNYRAKMNNGDGFNNDRARFMLLNALTNSNSTIILTPGNGNFIQGSQTVSVNYGDRVCFEVQSDNFQGVDSLTISDLIFSSNAVSVVQVLGPHSGDFLTPGNHLVSYLAIDCAGNRNACQFSINITAAPNHLLSNCSSDLTILIPDPADCDTLLDRLIPTINNYCTSFSGFDRLEYLGDGVFKSGPNTDHVAGTDGLVRLNNAKDTLTIVGTSNGTPPDPLALKFDTSTVFTCYRFPCGGTVSFDWSAMIRRIASTFLYDEAGYILYRNNLIDSIIVLSQPPLGNFASGSETVNVAPGDILYFFVKSGNFGFQDTFLVSNILYTANPPVLNQSCGPDLTSPVGPGVYDLCYDIVDCFGTRESCNFKLTVKNDYPLACKDVNLSLDSLCYTTVTPGMLLAGGGCTATMIVELSHYGKPILNPVDTNYLNKTIIGKVTDTLNGISCWSNILVEDKLAPGIICRADTIDCYRFNHDLPLLYSGYDCSRYTVSATSDITEHLYCDDNYLKRVYRNIKITDGVGNVSECIDTILVERIQEKDISLPTGIYELYCSENYRTDEQGHPSPYETGFPTFISEGVTLRVNPFVLLIDCNLLVSYEDIDLGEINCVRKIMRSWTVREWWCNTEIARTELQQIIIRDNVGPRITHKPYDFSATTGHKGCYANVNLPPIEAVDACHKVLRTDVVYPGGILINKNGGLAPLPVGLDTIIYRVYDNCYNVTEDTIYVTVIDETEPIAICDRRTVVAINDAGYNWVPAEVFDDGSFDECHLHHFEVRRMDLNACGILGEDNWGPEVGFCCADVGKSIMVGFKAIDFSGNEAICMVMVEVQDKDVPRITCPPSISIDCRFDIDVRNLGNSFGRVPIEESLRDTIVIDKRYWHEFDGHPFDGIAYDNCNPSVIETVDTSGMNQCGLGLIIRKFVVTDNFNNRDSCYQRITIGNHNPIRDLNIYWPLDFEVHNICDPSQLRPELLNQPYQFPTFADDECSLIGLDYTDHIFSATVPGDPCYKIFREWKVIDWCYRDDANNIKIFRDTQIIKVKNTVDPVITRACRDTSICSYDVQCNPIPVSLSIAATDFCTNSTELLYRYKIDFNSDGTFDVNHAEIGNPVASGTWPIGRHIIKWEVEDRCGNTAICQSQLNLLNCKPPTAYAHKDLAIGLTGMDTNGDGIPDTKMATVWASDLDAGSNHSCGYRLKLSFSRDTNDISRVYTCDSIGPRNVELWATDVNGNTSFVKTLIIVNDNPQQNPPCPRRLTAKISGLIHSSNNEEIEQVEVNLENSNLAGTVTNYDGIYSFGEMTTGGSYAIRPYRNDEWLNGVSTADIVKIQKHILGKELLLNPYQYIAADVNNSKKITTADISELRKLILGLTNEVTKNTSWRFVNEYYSFGPIEEVLNESYPESYDIPNLSSNVQGNFIGIKVGDVTNNAKTRGLGGKIESRSNVIMDLSIENQSIHKNEITEISFGSKNINEIQGFQLTLEINPRFAEILEIVGNKNQKFGEDNFSMAYLSDGKITISWNNENGKVEENIFTMRIKSKVDGKVSDILQINSSITEALSVDKHGEEGKIQLRTFNGSNNEFIVMQNEPNPWKNTTTIGMLLPYKGEVVMTVYDLSGRVFYRSSKNLEKGYSEWNLGRAELLQPGVYYYQLDFETSTKTNKMIVVE